MANESIAREAQTATDLSEFCTQKEKDDLDQVRREMGQAFIFVDARTQCHSEAEEARFRKRAITRTTALLPRLTIPDLEAIARLAEIMSKHPPSEKVLEYATWLQNMHNDTMVAVFKEMGIFESEPA